MREPRRSSAWVLSVFTWALAGYLSMQWGLTFLEYIALLALVELGDVLWRSE